MWIISSINNSIAASWLILTVMLIRRICSTVPKQIQCFMWMLVGVRLVMPIMFTSTLCLIPSVNFFDESYLTQSSFSINTGIDAIDEVVNSYIGDCYYEGVTVANGHTYTVMSTLQLIWLAGIFFGMIFYLYNWLYIKRQLLTSVYVDENIWKSDIVKRPFVYGIFRPRIYVPFHYNKMDMEYILLHEKMHIRRGDVLVKTVAYVVLILNWYNPFVWIAYHNFLTDIELACDEMTVCKMGMEMRVIYSEVLLKYATGNIGMLQNRVYLGGVNLKLRIQRIMKNYSTSKVMNGLGILLCVFLTVCFLTNPK